MWLITDVVKELNEPNLYIKLNPNQNLNPYNIKYPIIWSGTINGKSIKIIQAERYSSHSSDFNFESPLEHEGLKGHIAELIDKTLHNFLD
jgi:hypothetical protein